MDVDAPNSQDAFTIERRGEVTLIVASPALEAIDPNLLEEAGDLLLAPIRDQEGPLVVFDLARVDYFGSLVLSLMLRCWKLVLSKGGLMVLASPSDRIRELLRITSLDIVWPIYATRAEAIESLLAD